MRYHISLVERDNKKAIGLWTSSAEDQGPGELLISHDPYKIYWRGVALWYGPFDLKDVIKEVFKQLE